MLVAIILYISYSNAATYLVTDKHINFQDECLKESHPEYLSLNLWLFVGSQLLTGAGAAPLYTLGVTYLDENVTKKMSSVYLGKSL